MNSKDLCIDKENENIRHAIADSNLSFGAFLVTSPAKKLSVTAKYVLPEKDKAYISMNRDFSIKPVSERY